MALPKLDTPIYELHLNSIDQNITYRPFLVKEEKILLTAMESKDPKAISTAIKQILINCTIEPAKLNIDKLPSFEIEYYFLNLRSRSVGENIKILLNHPEETNQKKEPCTHQQEVEINIDDIKLTENEKHTNKIMVTDKVGVVLNYPSINSVFSGGGENNTDAVFTMIINSIDSIFDEEDVYLAKDTKKSELNDFVLNLNQSQFAKLMEFYQTMPKLQHELTYTCSQCQEKETINLEGLQSFFI